MKAHLAHGPLVCDFMVTEDFENFTFKDDKGMYIYDKKEKYFQLNHAVSLVGWGIKKAEKKEEKDIEYWVVRNSWGRHWGDEGFFYMKIGENVLGFESDCSYAVPEFSE